MENFDKIMSQNDFKRFNKLDAYAYAGAVDYNPFIHKGNGYDVIIIQEKRLICQVIFNYVKKDDCSKAYINFDNGVTMIDFKKLYKALDEAVKK